MTKTRRVVFEKTDLQYLELVYIWLNFDYSFCLINVWLADRRLHFRDAFEKLARRNLVITTHSKTADDIDTVVILMQARRYHLQLRSVTIGTVRPVPSGRCRVNGASRFQGRRRRRRRDQCPSVATYTLANLCWWFPRVASPADGRAFPGRTHAARRSGRPSAISLAVRHVGEIVAEQPVGETIAGF